MARSLTDRMIGALRLQEDVYEEVEADEKATGEAAFIIVATSLVSGAVNGVTTGVSSGFFGALGSFLGWAFYAWVAYIVDVKLFPGLAALTRTVVGLWVLVATVIALRAALDITTARAIGVAIASVIGQLVI